MACIEAQGQRRKVKEGERVKSWKAYTVLLRSWILSGGQERANTLQFKPGET